MRRWKDALQEYKLQHGSYDVEDASALGVTWPSDWKKEYYSNNPCGDSLDCKNDYWNDCTANDAGEGYVYCLHNTSDGSFYITMYPPDYDYENFRDKIVCYADGDEAHKICKALGGKLAEEDGDEYILY